MAKKLAVDRLLFVTVILLVGFGLVMVYSASTPKARGEGASPLFVRQCLAAAVGFALMLVAMHTPYGWLRRRPVIWALTGGIVLALAAVLTQPPLNNTRRWFFLGPLSVQPAELAKLALVPFVAYQIDRRDEEVNSLAFLVPVAVVLGAAAILVLSQPDLGTAALLVMVVAVLIFLAGFRLRYVLASAAALAGLLFTAIVTSDYRRERLLAFLHPESDPLGAGYQPLQSLIAVGSGGLFGRGPGESLQKLYYLPYPESDFIFSIVAEELGLIGALAVLALFAVVLWRGMRAGLRAPDRFGRYLAFGLTLILVIQALLHIGVSVAVLPTKGIPLPFISYGGTALVVAMAASGILLNISEHG